MPTAELPRQPSGLANDVASYLDQLAAGLSEQFPKQSFQHLELFGRLGVIARLYEQMLKSYLAPYDIMPVEHQVLVTLRSGVAAEPAALANATQQTRAGMTSTLDRLEQRKLVRRAQHPTDRRKRVINLTKTGTNLTNKLVSAQNQALSQALQPLNEKQHNQMNKKLDLLIALLSAPE